jgi:hypothetical protein
VLRAGISDKPRISRVGPHYRKLIAKTQPGRWTNKPWALAILTPSILTFALSQVGKASWLFGDASRVLSGRRLPKSMRWLDALAAGPVNNISVPRAQAICSQTALPGISLVAHAGLGPGIHALRHNPG